MNKNDKIVPKSKSYYEYGVWRIAKIIKIFQLEVGALESRIVHPEVTTLSKTLTS